jgi:hypothetical protein
MIGYAPSSSPRFAMRDLKVLNVEVVAERGRWEMANFPEAQEMSLAPSSLRPRSRSKRCMLIHGDLSVYVQGCQGKLSVGMVHEFAHSLHS